MRMAIYLLLIPTPLLLVVVQRQRLLPAGSVYREKPVKQGRMPLCLLLLLLLQFLRDQPCRGVLFAAALMLWMRELHPGLTLTLQQQH